ncbi:hypothetical protein [Streptomyces sp. NPDC088135]|uniref:hypothetical protein n=1 Tax=Streptomyces sp. NPDC088135 TaxID=3160993 RepID=UPI00344725DA
MAWQLVFFALPRPTTRSVARPCRDGGVVGARCAMVANAVTTTALRCISARTGAVAADPDGELLDDGDNRRQVVFGDQFDRHLRP